MTLWIDSNWLGRVRIPMDCPDMEESIKEKGRNGCRYVRIGSQNNDAYIMHMFDRGKAIPDVERYNICKSNCTVRLVSHRRGRHNVRLDESNYNDCLCRPQYRGDTVVLLLESPHEDEYDNCGDPIAPAQGTTGRNTHSHLECVLRRILHNNMRQIRSGCNTRVILCNPVQFQTSLHMILDVEWQKSWRDKVWLTLWNEPIIQQCFRARMALYNPKFAINACTGERTRPRQHNINSPKRKVTAFLKCIGVDNIYETGHPSSWRSQDNIKIVRV